MKHNQQYLSDRQKEIFLLIGRDALTNNEIAARFGCALSTVKTHVHTIMMKMEVSSRTELAIMYWKSLSLRDRMEIHQKNDIHSFERIFREFYSVALQKYSVQFLHDHAKSLPFGPTQYVADQAISIFSDLINREFSQLYNSPRNQNDSQ